MYGRICEFFTSASKTAADIASSEASTFSVIAEEAAKV